MPSRLMLMPPKVAIPAAALAVVAPESVPLEGLVPIAIETEFVAVVTVFPPLSCTATCIAGETATPSGVFDG